METSLVRRWLFFAMALSLAANVGHTLLAESTIPAWMRMIGAVAWPLLVYAAVDITVKVAWDLLHGRRSGIWLARLTILIPGIPALITSYEHMHGVLLALGERSFIALIGPGAVDLFMVGATITLVLIQRTTREPAAEPAAEVVPMRYNGAETEALVAERKPRATPAEMVSAVTLILNGSTADEAAEKTGLGASTLRRYVKVIKMVRSGLDVDPRAEKVRPELLSMIRASLAERAG